MIDASNMSHEEYFRVNGTLSPERVEEALDALISLDAVQDAAVYAKDAKAGYIAEDFLGEQLKDLQRLAKNMRGDNRHMLLDIIAQIEEEVLSEVRNGEYGAECLGKMESAMWS